MNPVQTDRVDFGLAPVDQLICAYLALPLLVFCAWFKWPAALVLGLLGLGAFIAAVGVPKWRPTGLPVRTLVALALLAFAWTALSGVGHFVYANPDWYTRDAVLRDLVKTPWPPAYDMTGDWPLILRAPVGYYLPVALFGSLAGLDAADLALYVWTAAGFLLFAWAAMLLFRTRGERLLCVALLVGFGGLDLVGWYLGNGYAAPLGEHVDRWSPLAQYSSNSTLLFWVPNHALPAWLGTLLALRHWRQPALARVAPLVAAAIPLWSPLAAIGLAPYFVAGIAWRRDWRILFNVRAAFPLYAVALIAARYLTLSAARIPSGWSIHQYASVTAFLRDDLLFCLLEFGIIAAILVRLGVRDLPFLLAIAILGVLPLYRFGASDDLAMRSSIPALTVLALATVRPMLHAGDRAWRAILAVVLIVGALGSAQEPERAILHKRWAMKRISLGQVGNERGTYLGWVPPHYGAYLNHPGLSALLREPSPVQPEAASR